MRKLCAKYSHVFKTAFASVFVLIRKHTTQITSHLKIYMFFNYCVSIKFVPVLGKRLDRQDDELSLTFSSAAGRVDLLTVDLPALS